MKKKNILKIVVPFLVVAVLMGLASWYSITYNEGRIIYPMDYSQYVFQWKDLPAILSIIFVFIYVIYVIIQVVLICRKAMKEKEKNIQSNRFPYMNPKLGFLAILGFIGIIGLLPAPYGDPYFLFFFTLFGFVGFYFYGKISNTLMDERFIEDKKNAEYTAMKISFSILYIGVILSARLPLVRNNNTTLISYFYLLSSIAFGLYFFLSPYLLYRSDQKGLEDEAE